MEDWKKDRIGSALKGEYPMIVARMRSGFAVMADTQFLPGYCILLAYPKAISLNDLNIYQRQDFLIDMSMIGDAIIDACKPIRINYDISGNTEHFLHGHIVPRYGWEEEERKTHPVCLYPKENWTIEKYQYSEGNNGQLRTQLSMKLQELMEKNYK